MSVDIDFNKDDLARKAIMGGVLGIEGRKVGKFDRIRPLNGDEIAAYADYYDNVPELQLAGYDPVKVSRQTYDLIVSRLSSITDNSERQAEEIRIASALSYSRNLNLPFSYAMSNLDEISQAWNGIKYSPTPTNFRAIGNSFRLGFVSSDRGKLGTQLMQETDPVKRQAMLEQVAEYDRQIAELYDYVPRPWYVELLKLGAENLSFIGESTIAGLEGRMAGEVVAQLGTKAAGLSIAPGAVAGVGTVAAPTVGMFVAAYSLVSSFSRMKNISQGNMYLDLISQGIPHDTASVIAGTTSSITSAIELLGGIQPSWLKAAGIDVDTIASRFLAKALVRGHLSELATFGIRLGAESITEGSEEVFQGIVEGLAEDYAFAVSGIKNPNGDRNWVKEAAENFAGGFGVSVLLGGLPVAITNHVDFTTVRNLNGIAANTPSKESYNQITAELRPEDVKEADWKQITDKVYSNEQKRRMDEFSKKVDSELDTQSIDPSIDLEGREDDQVEGTDVGIRNIQRLNNGRINSTEREGTRLSNSLVGHVRDYGAPQGGTRYGSVEYVTDGDGNLTIRNVRTVPGYEGVREEMVRDFISGYPDYDISWETRNIEETSLRDRIINDNPRGASNGLNYVRSSNFDDLQRVKNRLDIFSYDDTEKSALAEIIEMVAHSQNMTGSVWLDTYISDMRRWTPEEQAEANRGLPDGYSRAGASVFELGESVRAAIYAGEHANASTFLHELTHILRRIGNNGEQFRTLFNSLKNDAEFQAFVDNSKIIKHKDLSTLFQKDEWTEAEDEFFAELGEEYWFSGQTANSRVRNFFQRLTDAIRRIYRSIRRTGRLNKEVVDYFDSLYGAGPDSTVQQNTTVVQDNVHSTSSTSDISIEKETEVIEKISEETIENAATLSGSDGTVMPDVENLREGEIAASAGTVEEIASPASESIQETLHSSSDYENGRSYGLNEWNRNRFRSAIEKKLGVNRWTDFFGITNDIIKEACLVRTSNNDSNSTQTAYDIDPRFEYMTSADSAKMARNIQHYKDEKQRYENARRMVVSTTSMVSYTAEGKRYEETVAIDANGEFSPSKYLKEAGMADGELHFSIDQDNVRLLVGSRGEIWQGVPDPNMVWSGIPDRTPHDDASRLEDAEEIVFQTVSTDNQEWKDTERKVRANAANFDIAGRPLAPNGQLSKLPYKQWIAVRTPSFISWFGDWINNPEKASKVVDDNGEPKIVYHGTTATRQGYYHFTEFHISGENEYSSGSYFSDKTNVAAVYADYKDSILHFTGENSFDDGRLYAVFLNIREPLVVDAEGRNWLDVYGDNIDIWEVTDNETGDVIDVIEGSENIEAWKASHPELDEDSYSIDFYDLDESNSRTTTDVVAQTIREGGHDGVVFNNIVDGGEDASNVYVVISKPSQIKSIDNTGTFSNANDNILFQTAFHGSRADFDKFNLSYLSTGAGSQVFGVGVYVTQSERIGMDYADLAYTAERKQEDIEHFENSLKKAKEELDRFDADRRDDKKMEALKESDRQHAERFYEKYKASGKPVSPLLSASYGGETTWEGIRDRMLERIKEYPREYTDAARRQIEEKIAKAEQSLEEAKAKPIENRHIYVVDIPDSGYLAWDKKVPAIVARKIAKALKADEYDTEDIIQYFRESGESMYNYLKRQFSYDEKAVADFLSSIGIVGIDYPAGTRVSLPEGVPKGTRNFVVFNPDNVRILYNTLFQTVKNAPRMENMRENSYDAAKELAEEAHPQFVEDVESIRKLLGLSEDDVAVRKTIKDKDRSIEKAFGDYSGDFSKILDYDGAMLSFNSIKEAEEAWNRIKEIYNERIIKEKHLVSPSGYEDFKINIRMNNGSVAEIQFLDRDIANVKMNGIGHELYKIERTILTLGEERLESLLDAILKWSQIEYGLSKKLEIGGDAYSKFEARLSAISSVIKETSSHLSPYQRTSSLVTGLSDIVPSGEGISLATGQALARRILNGISLISANANSSAIDSSNTIMEGNMNGVNGFKGNLFQTVDDSFFEIEDIKEDVIENPAEARASMDASEQAELEGYFSQMVSMANNYTSFEEYKSDVEWVYPDDDMIERAWNTAKNPVGSDVAAEPAAPTLEHPDMSVKSEDDKDRHFIEIINTEEGFSDFIYSLNPANTEAVSSSMRNEIERALEREAAPLIKALVFPSGKTQKTSESSERSKRSARGIIKANATFYRDLYAKATGNTFWESLYGDGIPQDIAAEMRAAGEYDDLSISARQRVAEHIKNQRFKNAILQGKDTYDSPELASLIREQDEAITSVSAERDNLSNELKELQNKYDWVVAKANTTWSQLSNRDAQIKRLQEKIAELSEKIANAARAGFGNNAGAAQRLVDRQAELSKQLGALMKQQRALYTKMRQSAVDKAARKARHEQYGNDMFRMRQLRQQRDEKIAELKQHYREREALRRVQDYKRRLGEIISREPSKNVALEEADKIYAIQAMIDPNFRKNMRINGQVWNIETLKAMFRGDVARDPIVFDSLSAEQLDRLSRKDLSEWTISELENMATAVRALTQQGLRRRQAAVLMERARIAQYRKRGATVIANSGRYDGPPPLSGSEEERKTRHSIKGRIRSMYYSTINMARKAQMLDYDGKAPQKGFFYNLLVGMRRDAENIESRAIESRMKSVMDHIESNNIDMERFYEKFKIDLGNGLEQTYDFSQLAYIYFSQNNKRNRDAVAYGNLVSSVEKMNIKNEVDEVVIDIDERRDEYNERIREIGDARYDSVVKQAEAVIKNESRRDLFKVARLIEKDFNNPNSFQRIALLMDRVYNRRIAKEDYYLPINRQDFVGKELGDVLKEDLLNQIPGNAAVNTGMAESRLNFTPYTQTAVNLDLFNVWRSSIYNQEHAIAFIDYVRTLKGVFINKGSEGLRQMIVSANGESMLRDIEDYINQIANPNSFKKADPTNNTLRLLRGALYASYLGFKTSSVVLQAITSPMPTLGAVNPLEMAQAYLHMMSNPMEMWREVSEKSSFIANRSYHPLVEWMKTESQRKDLSKFRKVLSDVEDIGMLGLEWVDRFAVAGSWYAVYKKQEGMLRDSVADGNKMTDAQIEAEAIRRADDFIQETQPQSNITELSPMFQNRNEALSILTQFQASLNVIWQNITFDVPAAIKNGRFQQAVGLVMGYVVAGALLGMIQDGFDEDDDDKDKFRKILYWMTTQVTSGVPFISDYVDNAVEAIATGESSGMLNSPSFPAADKLFRAVSNAAKGNYAKSMENFLDTILLFSGLPYSGLKELGRTIGIGDGDGAFSFHPEELIGRRQ